MIEEKVILALKVSKVFLTSLGLKNNIILNKELIDWFIDRKYNFVVFKNGEEAGKIFYYQDKIMITANMMLNAVITIDNPYHLSYSFTINDKIVSGEFKIKPKENNYNVKITGLIESLLEEAKIKFTIDNDNFINLASKTKDKEEKLIINPKNKIISYDYKAIDDEHKILFTSSVKGTSPCMLGTCPTFIIERKMSFNGCDFNERHYQPNLKNQMQIFTLMQSIYPEYKNNIQKLNEILNGWLSNILELTNGEYSNEEILAMIGITKNKLLINKQGLNEYMNNQKMVTLTLRKDKNNG